MFFLYNMYKLSFVQKNKYFLFNISMLEIRLIYILLYKFPVNHQKPYLYRRNKNHTIIDDYLERTEIFMKTFKTSNLWKRFLYGALSALMIFGGGRSPTVVDAADTFTLNVKVNNTANNGLGNIELDWSSYTNKNATFKGYQSKDEGKTWQTMSLMDYTSVKEIKVLQIYPVAEAKDQLKTWMETNGYGKGIIRTNAVSILDFNNNPDSYLKDLSGNWKYDVIFFGTWDGGGSDLTTASTQIVEQYIKDGKGCIFGHDTIYHVHPNMWSLRNYFNIAEYSSNTFPIGSKVYISKKGLFTSYPWKIGEIGKELVIPRAHSQYTHQANGDIWLRFSGYEENNQNFYLTTYNNCAMIQTGHSVGQATEDEQKIIANLIFYSYQLSEETSVTDNSAMDTAAPTKPVITLNGNKYNLASTDKGTSYQHKIEAFDMFDTSKLLNTSNVTSSTVISGFKGYRYIYDNSSDTKITGVNGTAITNDIIPYDSRYGYLHAAAVDNAGNVSETSTITVNQNTINYNAETVYPSWALDKTHAGGTLNITSETVNGNQTPVGATATTANGFTFDGWYSSSGVKVTNSPIIKPLNCNAEKKGGFIYPSNGGSSIYNVSTDTYTITTNANTGVYKNWGSGVYHISAEIPWNNWYIAEFEAWSPIDAECVIDINNWGPNGHSWNGNDNDNTGTRFYYQNRTDPVFSLKANTWKKIVIWYQNSNSKNTNHESLWDQHTIAFRYNESLGSQTFNVRNYKAAVSPTLIKELDTFTARFKPYEHTVAFDLNGGTGPVPTSFQKCTWTERNVSTTIPTRTGYTFKSWNTKKDGSGTAYNPGQTYNTDQNGGTVTLYAQWQYNPVSVKVPQILTGDHTGKSQFRVKCDSIAAGNITVEPDSSFNYIQDKLTVKAAVKRKSSSSVIDKNNHSVVYDIITDKPLAAGCWHGNFNIKLTLTKE